MKAMWFEKRIINV